MKILLSGYNVDADVLEELKKHSPPRQDITPETLSAAYARISRDPRPINELRAAARTEVEKARKSNRNIIFKMGHHSVAEHAVFNFDIIGVSRLAMEWLERFRLASYTEKSQRYITLGDDFYVPKIIKKNRHYPEYLSVIKKQNAFYVKLFDKLKTYVFNKNSELAGDPKNHNLLEGWAKEDARYITPLSTLGQLGLTINARNLEYLLRRFASQGLAEVRDIGENMFQLAGKIAPSILLFASANTYDATTYPQIAACAQKLKVALKKPVVRSDPDAVTLVNYTAQADVMVLAALLFVVEKRPHAECLHIARKMTSTQRLTVFKKAFENLQFYDAVLREFEFANLTFEVVVSAAAFGQLKRHRMMSISSQAYDPALGITLPAAVREIGEEKNFYQIARAAEKVFQVLSKDCPLEAPYVLTNAHRRRVLINVNARELYHLVRLRDDQHAQWDIRLLASAMAAVARRKMPLIFSVLCGKDQYPKLYEKLFSRHPAVLPEI